MKYTTADKPCDSVLQLKIEKGANEERLFFGSPESHTFSSRKKSNGSQKRSFILTSLLIPSFIFIFKSRSLFVISVVHTYTLIVFI